MRTPLFTTIVAVGALLSGPAGAQEPQDPVDREEAPDERVAGLDEERPESFRVYWKDGLRMETGDGRFQVRVGGRIMNDWVFWDGDPGVEAAVGELEDGVEFRRARLFVQGYLYRHVEFKAQYEFAGGVTDFKDVYLGLRDLPVGVRLGHFKEPFGLEELTSSKYITFLERSLPAVFAPSRNVGLMAHGSAADDRVSYGVGVFRETDDLGLGTGDDLNFTARLTGAPVYADDGHRAVHLGVGVTHQSVDEATGLRFRQRPEVHLAPRFVDTGSFPADSLTVVGLEGATVLGPASVQGEYTTAAVDSAATGDPTLDGFYVAASYWLTGESRAYEPDDGTFGRVRPRRHFLDGAGGPGAWEVAVRYSTLDLEDEGLAGGEVSDVTVGVNWHWNPNARLMLNAVRSRLEGVDDVTALLLRTQIDF